MVPVGGAVVVSPDAAFIDAVSSCYPGRASMTPILDLFITLLSMGEDGYRGLLAERQRLCVVLEQRLQGTVAKHGLEILPATRNSISTAISLNALVPASKPGHLERLTFLGSMLYQRSVSGCRVVACTDEVKTMAGYAFCNWGAHMQHYPHSYFTVACSIGITEEDIDLFLDRLDKVIVKFQKKWSEEEVKRDEVDAPAKIES